MSWYFIFIGFLYPPFLFLPVGLAAAIVWLIRYLRRAPGRWREAGWRAVAPRIRESSGPTHGI